MTEKKVTVIVPVYNGEAFLRRCMDSILCQTYGNLEVIVVDDGSTDRSGAICDGYAEKDSRVRVLHQENSGVSSARNLGLQAATGEYIVFVDADDRVSETYVSNLMASEADYVAAGCFAQDGAGNWTRWRNDPMETRVAQVRKCPELLEKIPVGTVWGRRYKRRIIRENKLQFAPRIHRGEDTLFNLEYLSCCGDVTVTDAGDYWYYRTESSLTGTFEPRLFDWSRCSLEIIAGLIGEDSDVFQRRVWNNAMAVCDNYFQTGKGCRRIGAVLRVCRDRRVRKSLACAKNAGQRKKALLVRFFLYPFLPLFSAVRR